MHRTLWLPAHPASGAASMDRYWRELERQRLLYAGKSKAAGIFCPLGSPPEHSRTAPRLVRAWRKYYAYPRLAGSAGRQQDVTTVHVLDHSYAHLLAALPRCGVYKIATVHDLAPLRDASALTLTQQERFRRVVEHLHAADLLLADSQHSAEETIALLGVESAKLCVLPLGVDYDRFATRLPATTNGSRLPAQLAGSKIVLSVGVDIPRKNLGVLPGIFRHMASSGTTLLRVGTPLSAPLAAELRLVLGRDGLVELGFASDEVLIQAYQRADALIFPSRIEGFGFPVLEAMAAGCPVVCTDVTSLPEVGGDAALYFAPDDPAAAAGHLQRLLADKAFKENVIAAGRRQAATFSWVQHFEHLLAIYEGKDIGRRRFVRGSGERAGQSEEGQPTEPG